MRFLIFVFLVFLCAACNAGKSVRGVYFFSHETSAFVPCGTNDLWWFDGQSKTFNEIMEIYLQIVDEEYGNLYLELEGEFTKKYGNSDYVGIFEPMKIISHSKDGKLIFECVPNIEKLK